MSSPAPAFESTAIKHLFATPLVTAQLPAALAAEINPQILQLVLDKAQKEKGVSISNAGGWQSDARLPEWGGKPIDILLEAMRGMLRQITIHIEDGKFERKAIDWKINGWANINRKGNANVAHSHPGAFWSAVYYVSVDNGTPEKPHGGDIEFIDPRGPLPLMYCPLLHFGIQNYATAGKKEAHTPEAGQCIFFPSWLVHAVQPYTGDGTRVSLAFNFSV
jgi:uncharacterized protein (TIGR02466 family)